MSIDQYQLCPCGSNKKVKFCCARDVLPEINKVLTALQGDQRVAALDHVNNAIEKKGDKDCLLNIKTNILLQLGEEEKARETSKQVLKKNPDNPIALANHGLLDAAAGELDNAVDKLQQCLDLIGDNIPYSVIEAIRIVGISLLQSGRVIAARNHLQLYQGYSQEEDEKISRLIMQTYTSPKIPLLMKVENPTSTPPEDAPWKNDCQTALELGSRGRWLSAVELLQEVDEKYPNEPVIRRNIAVFQNCLGTAEDMAESWSDYAHTPGVEFEDAVEAEAFAQLIDPELESELLDVVAATFEITDQEKLNEILVSDKRCESIPVDEERFPGDQPKPRSAYLVFDKVSPESVENLTREDVPNVCVSFYVFGKQTDAEARILVMTTKNDQYDDKITKLKEVVGDCISDEKESKVISQVTKLSDALTWDWRFPEGTSQETQNQLLKEQRREIMLEVWPKLPQASLGDKAPIDVIGQEKYRIALAASVLLLELSTDHQVAIEVDLDEVRQKLEVPVRKTFKHEEIEDYRHLSIVRMSQLELAGVPDDELVALFQRAAMTAAWSALTGICHELLNRDSLEEKIDKSSVYLMLSRMQTKLDDAIGYIQKARSYCIGKKQSPARTLIAELETRIERSDFDRVPDLIREIETKYISEPGISRELMRVLVRFGIVDPQGNPRSQAGAPAAMNEQAGPSESQYAWAPDGGMGGAGVAAEPETKAEAKQEKKLWIPGMD